MAIGFDGGFGLLAGVSIVVGIVFWALVIVALVLAIRWLLRQNGRDRAAPPSAPPVPNPLDTLRDRYARGEIDDEEYERRRKTLGG